MKITPKASEMLLSFLKENDRDYVHIYLQPEEDAIRIKVELLKKEELYKEDRVLTIQEVPLVLSLEDEEAMEDIVFDEKDGELSVLMTHHDCCCHHHDGECCHHEDGEECCCNKD